MGCHLRLADQASSALVLVDDTATELSSLRRAVERYDVWALAGRVLVEVPVGSVVVDVWLVLAEDAAGVRSL
jgi:hypothetical protein